MCIPHFLTSEILRELCLELSERASSSDLISKALSIYEPSCLTPQMTKYGEHDVDVLTHICKRCRAIYTQIADGLAPRCISITRCSECTLVRECLGTPPRCQECLDNIAKNPPQSSFIAEDLEDLTEASIRKMIEEYLQDPYWP